MYLVFFYFLSFNVISSRFTLLLFSSIMFAAVYQFWFNKNDMMMIMMMIDWFITRMKVKNTQTKHNIKYAKEQTKEWITS